MNKKQIFKKLFKIAKKSKDPEGVVAACLVKNGEIIASSPSADDGIRHAEDLVIEKAIKQGVMFDSSIILYTTLEPCSYRSPTNNVKDCTTLIINAGIKNVIFAGQDPEFSKEAKKRFKKAGVKYCQIKDRSIIKKSIELFNSTIKIPLTTMNLPRKKKIISN